jgi:hypothetical protein
MIAATAQTKAASENPGGFFHHLPLPPFNFPDKLKALTPWAVGKRS